MAKQKLTELTQTSSVNSSDLLYIVQSNTSKSVNVGSIFNSFSTANLAEVTNLYYSNARVYSNVISLLNNKANITDQFVASKIITTTAPASANATGNVSEIRFDSNYIYVCVDTNTWKRANLYTW